MAEGRCKRCARNAEGAVTPAGGGRCRTVWQAAGGEEAGRSSGSGRPVGCADHRRGPVSVHLVPKPRLSVDLVEASPLTEGPGPRTGERRGIHEVRGPERRLIRRLLRGGGHGGLLPGCPLHVRLVGLRRSCAREQRAKVKWAKSASSVRSLLFPANCSRR